MIHPSDLDVVTSKLTIWIKEKIEEAGAKTAVVGLSGGADSALVAILCQQVVPTFVVKMPCHSSPSSLARADELIGAFPKLQPIRVDLIEAFQSIAHQVNATLGHDSNNASDGALRSCLRAPTLDFVAKRVNGLIVGTGNRDEDEVTRYFQKRGDGCVDISPIAKLHKSEVYQLLTYLKCPKSIIDAIPSADLWGPNSGQEDEKELGLTYKEIEWAIGFNERSEIFDYDECNNYDSKPFPRAELLTLTPRQFEVLKKVAHLEKISRHKAELPPVFDIREDNKNSFV